MKKSTSGEESIAVGTSAMPTVRAYDAVVSMLPLGLGPEAHHRHLHSRRSRQEEHDRPASIVHRAIPDVQPVRQSDGDRQECKLHGTAKDEPAAFAVP